MRERYNKFQEHESTATADYLRVLTLSRNTRNTFYALTTDEQKAFLKRISFVGPKPFPKPQKPPYPLTEEQEELPINLMKPLLDAYQQAIKDYEKELSRVKEANTAREAEHPGLCLEFIIQAIERRTTKGEVPGQPENQRHSDLATAERWFRQWPFDVFCARVLGREWRHLLPEPGTQISLV